MPSRPLHISAIPKYAVLENERRFLVDKDELLALENLPYWRIIDRYVVGTRLRLRSIAHSVTGNVEFKFCKKYPSMDPVSGAIVNMYLSPEEYETLVALPAWVITKRRYQIASDGQVFGLNVFEDNLTGLVLCEAEAQSRAAILAMTFPPWAGREVTDDLFFTGGHLCTLSAEQWRVKALELGH